MWRSNLFERHLEARRTEKAMESEGMNQEDNGNNVDEDLGIVHVQKR